MVCNLSKVEADFILPVARDKNEREFETIERYIMPMENLPADDREVEVFARLYPRSFYSFDSNPVYSQPESEPTMQIKSRVRKLNGLEFDTKYLEEGKYWFTLQSNAVFPGQSPDSCAKTTPPVLIEILKKKYKNVPPEVTLKPTYPG